MYQSALPRDGFPNSIVLDLCKGQNRMVIYNENSAERAGDFTHSTGAYGGTDPVVLVFNPVDRQGRDHTFADVAIDDYLELKNVEGSGFGLYVVKGKQGTELTCEPVKGGGAPKPTIEVEVRIFHAQGDGGGDYLPLTGGDLSGPLNINVNSGVALSVNSNKVKFWSSGAVELGAYTAFKDNELVTKKYTDDAIKTAVENIDIPEVPDVDLSSYATTAYVDDEISKSQIPEIPSPFRQLRFARDKDWNNLRPGEFGLMDKSIGLAPLGLAEDGEHAVIGVDPVCTEGIGNSGRLQPGEGLAIGFFAYPVADVDGGKDVGEGAEIVVEPGLDAMEQDAAHPKKQVIGPGDTYKRGRALRAVCSQQQAAGPGGDHEEFLGHAG